MAVKREKPEDIVLKLRQDEVFKGRAIRKSPESKGRNKYSFLAKLNEEKSIEYKQICRGACYRDPGTG